MNLIFVFFFTGGMCLQLQLNSYAGEMQIAVAKEKGNPCKTKQVYNTYTNYGNQVSTQVVLVVR